MPQFDVSTFSSQLFWLILVFGFLYIIVSKFIAPKAELILISRNRYLEDNINASENYNDKAQSLSLLKEKNLEELNFEAEEIRKNALETLENYFQQKKSDLNSVLNKKIAESKSQINMHIDSFHAKESDSCINLAAFIVEKITDKPADLKLLKKIHEAK